VEFKSYSSSVNLTGPYLPEFYDIMDESNNLSSAISNIYGYSMIMYSCSNLSIEGNSNDKILLINGIFLGESNLTTNRFMTFNRINDISMFNKGKINEIYNTIIKNNNTGNNIIDANISITNNLCYLSSQIRFSEVTFEPTFKDIFIDAISYVLVLFDSNDPFLFAFDTIHWQIDRLIVRYLNSFDKSRVEQFISSFDIFFIYFSIDPSKYTLPLMKYPNHDVPTVQLVGNDYLKPISVYSSDDMYFVEFQNLPSKYLTSLCIGNKTECLNPTNESSIYLENNISNFTVTVDIKIYPSSSVSIYIGSKDHISSLSISSYSDESIIYLSDTLSFSSISLTGNLNIQYNQQNSVQLQESTPVFNIKCSVLRIIYGSIINKNIRLNVDNTNNYYIPLEYENIITGNSNANLFIQELTSITFDDNGWLFNYNKSGIEYQSFINKSSRFINLLSIEPDLSFVMPSVYEPLVTLIFPDNLTNPSPIMLSDSMGRMKFVGKFGEFSGIVKIQTSILELYQEGTGVLPLGVYSQPTILINNISENVFLPFSQISSCEFFLSDSIKKGSYINLKRTSFSNSTIYGNDHILSNDSYVFGNTEIHGATFNNLTVELIDSNVVLSECKLLDNVLHINVNDITKAVGQFVIQVDADFLEQNYQYEVSSFGTPLSSTVSVEGNNLVIQITGVPSLTSVMPSSAVESSQTESSQTAQPESSETTQPESSETTQPEPSETTQPEPSETTEHTQTTITTSLPTSETTTKKSKNKSNLLLGILIPCSILVVAFIVIIIIIINKKRKRFSTDDGNDSNFVKIL